jgi:hypothetical protein
VRQILTVTSRAAKDVGLGQAGVDVTSDRARKRAARARAALTGERYVVARRKLEEPAVVAGSPGPEGPYPLVVRLIHDLTHRVPGVPKHADPASVRVEHEERHRARAAQVKARHEARASAARARHHRVGDDSQSSTPPSS